MLLLLLFLLVFVMNRTRCLVDFPIRARSRCIVSFRSASSAVLMRLFAFLFSLPDTSLTNFSAFLLGSMTKLPGVEYFCVYAATSILFVFILQVISR